MIIERSLRVMGITRNVLNQFGVRFKNLRVGAGQDHDGLGQSIFWRRGWD